MKPRSLTAGFVILLLCAATAAAQPATAPTTQRTSAFYPPHLLQRVRANIDRDDWGRSIRDQAIALAEPWTRMDDEQLWKLVFGATIPRSWMVWSNGHCPSCEKPVPMYDWNIDAINEPWKLRCPHCQEQFPKNDFARFHESGLDAQGVFDPAKADRSLLFNTEHPDKNDPLHSFGVDDGTGYVQGEKHWRFIPTYLVHGHWKQAIQLGIKRLATAYVISGDPVYAHKCAILLDRVADVYPTFDFKTQGILYESVRADGYVSVWHDATIETREMVMAYDAMRDAIPANAELVRFLVAKSAAFNTPTKKTTAADIEANIETRILRDALTNRHKIHSNFPQEHLTKAVIHTALDWPANRAEVFTMLDPIIEQTTAVDGTTGEKGLAGYSAYAAQRFAEFLGYYARMDEKFMPEMIQRHPRLPQMWRFFIDTWCADNRYYPLSGDTGYFAGHEADQYAGVSFLEDHGVGATGHMSGVVAPSMYAFLWSLCDATKDPAFAQVVHHRNKGSLDGLPFDLFHPDADAFRRDLQAVIDEHGADIEETSTNKTQWHLALLKSGRGDASRAAWLDYDTWGGHGHADGMNLGLFAKGLDLMPDFGYPPVQFGGWESPRANWYKSTLAHNTVTVNGATQPHGAAPGGTTLWAAGEGFSAVAADAPGLNPGVTTRFERTVALIDVSDHDAYLLDVFRVAGGSDHVKFYTGHFGAMAALGGLALSPATDFAHPQMRNVQAVRKPPSGWAVELKVEDRYKLLPAGADVRVRYTDFTSGADAYTCEAWVIAGIYNSTDEAWVPRLMTRRPGGESTFVTLVEPHNGAKPLIAKSERLPLTIDAADAPDTSVALHVKLTDGRSDVLVSSDTPGKQLVQADLKLRTDARLCHIRRSANGRASVITICHGRSLEIGEMKLTLNDGADFVQIRLDDDAATLVSGKPELINSIESAGKAMQLR
jgi:hypothetical protein